MDRCSVAGPLLKVPQEVSTPTHSALSEHPNNDQRPRSVRRVGARVKRICDRVDERGSVPAIDHARGRFVRVTHATYSGLQRAGAVGQ